MKEIKMAWLIIGLLTLLSLATQGLAEESVNFKDRVPEVDELVNALAPEQPSGYKTRAIRPTPKTEQPKSSISMEITFEKNSFQLTKKARETLAVLGKAFNAERLMSCQFIIEGHTDASGSAEYNMKLSRKRADAVKTYLATHSKVSKDRLLTKGKGENELLLEDNPDAAENRRVKIINNGIQPGMRGVVR